TQRAELAPAAGPALDRPRGAGARAGDAPPDARRTARPRARAALLELVGDEDRAAEGRDPDGRLRRRDGGDRARRTARRPARLAARRELRRAGRARRRAPRGARDEPRAVALTRHAAHGGAR